MEADELGGADECRSRVPIGGRDRHRAQRLPLGAREEGSEADRPLTRVGGRQAEKLVPVLSAFGVARALSSPWLRCTATLEPYVQACGLPLRTGEPLTEVAHAASPATVAAHVLDLLHTPGDAVLCTHRPVLPTVLDVLAEHSSRAVADELPHDDPFLRPGQVLFAHVADTAVGPRVIATQVIGPPAPDAA